LYLQSEKFTVCSVAPSFPVDVIRAVMNVGGIRGKIIRAVQNHKGLKLYV